jgi:ADP-ribosylglycohydrolase
MCGGGIWNTAPGQVTDDGELTALLRPWPGSPGYDVNRAARAYRLWYLSALRHRQRHRQRPRRRRPGQPRAGRAIARRASMFNSESKANGSLMRATPLGVWSARVSVEEAVDAARADARLTHPNPSCQWSTAAYVVAIRHLTLNADDHRGAFEAARSILPAGEGDEVRRWLDDAEAGQLPPFHPQAGFVKIAFTHAFTPAAVHAARAGLRKR